MTLRSARMLLHAMRNRRAGLMAVCRQAHTNVLTDEEVQSSRTSRLYKDSELYKDNIQKQSNKTRMDKQTLDAMREKMPDFLPDPHAPYRDKIREKLEREDMYRRRAKLEIPEFYVGSILAVMVSDQYSPGKKSRFLGICIQRSGHGLRHNFTLRNVIDKQGMEITYDMYSPLLQSIEVIRLEKRLDDNLRYLRDCPLEYSTFSQDMEPDTIFKDSVIKINTIKVPLNPRPWSERWERANLQGIQEIVYKNERVKEKLTRLKNHPQVTKLWEKEDIVKHYRESINPVEAEQVFTEVIHKKGKQWR